MVGLNGLKNCIFLLDILSIKTNTTVHLKNTDEKIILSSPLVWICCCEEFAGLHCKYEKK